MQFTWNDWGVQGSLDLLPLWQLKIPIPGLRYFQPDTVSTPDYLNCLQSKVNHRYKQWRHVQGTVSLCFNMMDGRLSSVAGVCALGENQAGGN